MNDRHGSQNPVWLILGVALTCVLGARLIIGLKARAQAEADREFEQKIQSVRAERRIDQEPLKTLPPFRLTRARGGELALDDLKGKVWVADFFFTQCPTVCPTMSGTEPKRVVGLDPCKLGVCVSSLRPKTKRPKSPRPVCFNRQ